MKVFTIADKPSLNLDRLLYSAKKFNHHIEVLGTNIKNYAHGHKLIEIEGAVSKLPDEEIVLFIDAHDAFLMCDENEILEKYRTFNAPLVFGAEANFAMLKVPSLPILFRYPKSPTIYRYLNSGTYIGTAGSIKELLRRISYTEKMISDQLPITLLFSEKTRNQGLIALDYYQRLFTCNGGRLGAEDIDYTVKNNRVVVKHTGEMPCVVHFPGRIYYNLDPLAKACGLWTPPKDFYKNRLNSQLRCILHRIPILIGFNSWFHFRLTLLILYFLILSTCVVFKLNLDIFWLLPFYLGSFLTGLAVQDALSYYRFAPKTILPVILIIFLLPLLFLFI